MDFEVSYRNILSKINRYRVHIFVFFVALFIGLTLAHPAIFLNDEFITTNQLRQLHDGHQIIVNEGKFGGSENGTMSAYFAYRSNVLGYSLFLPLISLPTFWAIDITGEQFAYAILVLWTIISLILILFINRFFRDFSYIGRWQWTPVAIVAIFVLFFVNLYYYSPFSIDPVTNYPEILAIVFTNLILLAISAVMIYEINRTIFDDPAFSFFGTMVCLFSSSYFLWATFCKDHILVLAIFVPIFLCLVRFIKTDEYWYLPLAFLLSGTLAWARPELALWIFLLVCGIGLYKLAKFRSGNRSEYSSFAVICSPFFTIFGALPFFLNNYLITKNIFLPAQTLYLTNASPEAVNASQSLIRVAGGNSIQTVITMFLPSIQLSPLETFTDIAGIFFSPQTGNVSIFTLVPLFLVMTIVAGILLFFRKLQFTPEEKKIVLLSLLVSLAVFCAYASQIHLLNTDHGITPDIRYLSPMYLPLILIGLILVRKMKVLQQNSLDTVKELFWIGIIGAPVSLILLYSMFHEYFSRLIIPLGQFFTAYVFALIVITLTVLLSGLYWNLGEKIYQYLVLLLCSVPFFWQVTSTFTFYTFSAFGQYIFWIPIVRVPWGSFIYLIMR